MKLQTDPLQHSLAEKLLEDGDFQEALAGNEVKHQNDEHEDVELQKVQGLRKVLQVETGFVVEV
jgi:hypothetical protein